MTNEKLDELKDQVQPWDGVSEVIAYMRLLIFLHICSY